MVLFIIIVIIQSHYKAFSLHRFPSLDLVNSNFSVSSIFFWNVYCVQAEYDNRQCIPRLHSDTSSKYLQNRTQIFKQSQHMHFNIKFSIDLGKYVN